MLTVVTIITKNPIEIQVFLSSLFGFRLRLFHFSKTNKFCRVNGEIVDGK